MGMNVAWDHTRLSIDYGDEVVFFPEQEFEALREIVLWAAGRLPAKIVDKLPRLGLRNELEVRMIADEIAEQGYPWTANDVRTRWRSPSC